MEIVKVKPFSQKVDQKKKNPSMVNEGHGIAGGGQIFKTEKLGHVYVLRRKSQKTDDGGGE